MTDVSRRRARFVPSDPEHWNAGKVGWAYPPGTYEPDVDLGLGEDEGWTFEPDDEDELPNFASLEDLDFDV